MHVAVTPRPARGLTAVAVAIAIVLLAGATVDAATKNRRVSVTSGGAERVGVNQLPTISANGRFVAFDSDAALTGGANGHHQVYVRDRKRDKTKRVSKSNTGAAGSGNSSNASISANGRFIAFDSSAGNLVGGDGNGSRDVFVHDRKKRKTKRMSLRSDESERVGQSGEPSISADGRFVAFHSEAPLVASDSNGTFDIYVRDRKKGRTRRVSVTTEGDQGLMGSSSPSISRDGRFIVFSSSEAFVNGDTNGFSDIYIHDRKRKRTKRISKGFKGAEPDDASVSPWISPNGRFIVFDSAAENLIKNDDNGKVDVFIRDRRKGKTRRVSLSKFGQADGDSFARGASANGRFVIFDSSTKLVPIDDNGHFDIYMRDRKLGKTRLLSRDRKGKSANDDSRHPAISADGRFVAFRSAASDLIKNDGNGSPDVFVRRR